MSLYKQLRGVYYKYFARINFFTVHLRGSLNKEQEEYCRLHSSLLQKNWHKSINFESKKKKILEIGFGNGSHLLFLSEQFSDSQVEIFGVELDRISIFKILKKIDERKIKNLNIVEEDARVLVDKLRDKVLDQVYVLFPDPWPKRREQKRRLLTLEFIKSLIRKTKKAGQIYFATDIASYAEQVENSLATFRTSGQVHFAKFEEEVLGRQILHSLEEFGVAQIFETKFAQKAKKEGRHSIVFVVDVLQ
jgi:tRNA (guanine-N(7)-)-methyltransferase